MVLKCYFRLACKRHRGVTLHSFPKDPEMRSAWLKVCELNEGPNSKISSLRICALHFRPEDYIEPRAKELGGRLQLRSGAVPSIMISLPPEPCDTSINEPITFTTDEYGSIPNIEQDSHTGNNLADIDSTNASVPKKRSFVSEIQSADVSTPKKAKRVLLLAKNVFIKQNRKIRQLQSQNRHLKRRVSSLRKSLKRLKQAVPS